MRSNLEMAKKPTEKLLALAEINHFLSQIIASEVSQEIQLGEVGREGLANLFYLLAKECVLIDDILEEGNSHE